MIFRVFFLAVICLYQFSSIVFAAGREAVVDGEYYGDDPRELGGAHLKRTEGKTEVAVGMASLSSFADIAVQTIPILELSHKSDKNTVPYQILSDFIEGKLNLEIEDKRVIAPSSSGRAGKFNLKGLDMGLHKTKLRFRYFKGPLRVGPFPEAPMLVWQILKPFIYADGFSGLFCTYVHEVAVPIISGVPSAVGAAAGGSLTFGEAPVVSIPPKDDMLEAAMVLDDIKGGTGDE